MSHIIAKIICIIHICVIIFVVCAPLTSSPYFLMVHAVLVPFLIIHWLSNNNTCILTLAEKYFRDVKSKEEEDECLTYKLINPIFDFKKNYSNFSDFIYSSTIFLWILSILKLAIKYKNGEISTLKDMFTIVPKNK